LDNLFLSFSPIFTFFALIISDVEMAGPQVGWIGLGSMGIGMSKNLQKYLSSVNAPALIYTNRTLSRGADLQALGGIPVESVKEVAKKSEIIFSCVSVTFSTNL
jgi:3-hydroxyisobutyrate dehydrogenase-like beta-hydroxyacid dehydrogenase